MNIQILRSAIALISPFSGMRMNRDFQVYTNTQNVRHIALGKDYVAFAISGGIRIFLRGAGEWRTLNTNDGLSANNVRNVAFDPYHPDTLWMLGIIGAYDVLKYADGNLALASINLKTNVIRCATHKLSGYNDIYPMPYFVPNNLKVGRDYMRISIIR